MSAVVAQIFSLSSTWFRPLALLWTLTICVVFSGVPAFGQVETEAPDNEAAPSTELTAAEKTRLAEISRELGQRQVAIENMQSELGIYDLNLMEAYSGMAALYVEMEDYSNAISLQTDALQLARINMGLYSELQLPVIEDLVQSNIKLNDWQEVDDLHELGYLVSSRLYPIEDARYIAAVNGYGSWKLRVLKENLLDLNYRGLSATAADLSNFYNRAITRIETETTVKPQNLLQMIYGKSEADLALARSIASTPYTAFEGTASRTVSQIRCQNTRNAQGQVVRQCYSVQVENPRYRQSQRDAKQIALRRYTREVVSSIDRLKGIKASSTDMSAEQLQQLDVQIAQLETETSLIARSARRRSLF